MSEDSTEQAYSPWRDLRALGDDGPDGVIFGQVPLPSGEAWWVPEERVVLMEPNLLQVRRRCALAHELGHRHLGHSGQCHYRDAVRLGERAERAADDWAARKLITLEALADSLKWSDDPDEVAEDLWVTRRLLEVRLARMYAGERRKVGVLLRGARDEEPVHDGGRGGRGAARDELQQRRVRRRSQGSSAEHTGR